MVFGVGGSNGANSGWSKSEMPANRHVEKNRMAISQQWFDHWIHFMFGSSVGLINYTSRKERAFTFYTDLGPDEHNKICTQDVP